MMLHDAYLIVYQQHTPAISKQSPHTNDYFFQSRQKRLKNLPLHPQSLCWGCRWRAEGGGATTILEGGRAERQLACACTTAAVVRVSSAVTRRRWRARLGGRRRPVKNVTAGKEMAARGRHSPPPPPPPPPPPSLPSFTEIEHKLHPGSGDALSKC